MNSILSALVNGMAAGVTVTVLASLALRTAPKHWFNAATRYGIWWCLLAVVGLLPALYLPARTPAARIVAGTRVDPSTPAPQMAPLLPRTSASHPGARWRLHFPARIEAGPWAERILMAWAALAALGLIRLAGSYLALERHKRLAMDAPAEFAAEVNGWLTECGSSRSNVRLALSGEIAAPMLAGLGQPAILIPARLFARLDRAEIRMIGLHEAAHVARRDDWALLVQRLLEALFVLHPAVQWIGRALDLERESACDDLVLRATGDAHGYAACLARLVTLTGGVRGSLAATGVVERQSHLSRRVDRLLDGVSRDVTKVQRSRAALTAAALALIAIAARPPALVALAQASPAPVPIAAPAVQLDPGPVPTPQPLPTPQPASTVVRVQVTVRDPRDRYVTGLGREIFHLTEDAVPQGITAFTEEQTPVSLGILLDSSGSMATVVPQARRAIAELVSQVSPASRVFLITFADTVELAEPATRDMAAIQSRVDATRARGGTSLRDAVMAGLRQQGPTIPNRILWIVSDGSADNTSQTSSRDVEQAAAASGVEIHALTFRDGAGRDTMRGIEELDRLASVTGGEHVSIAPEGSAPAARFAARHVYTLEYRSPDRADGKFRKLDVRVTPPPGIPPLSVTVHSGNLAQ